KLVTGVQTCALPILLQPLAPRSIFPLVAPRQRAMAIAKAESAPSTSTRSGSRCMWITPTGCRGRRSIGRNDGGAGGVVVPQKQKLLTAEIAEKFQRSLRKPSFRVQGSLASKTLLWPTTNTNVERIRPTTFLDQISERSNSQRSMSFLSDLWNFSAISAVK